MTERPEQPPVAAPQRLRPVPATAGRCPRCERALVVRRLRVPGWRIVVDGSCAACGHRYVQDLPSGHGLVYPITLDLDTGETFDPSGAPWFAGALTRMWREPDPRPVRFEIEARRLPTRAALLDCLDPIWGHSLLKLLNVHRELAAGRDIVALIPASLRGLVPCEVAEVWVVDEPSRRADEWMLELERRLDVELDRLGDCVLAAAAPHPHPATYDLAALVAGCARERLGDPQIALCLRDDRLWGAGPAAQAGNVAALCGRLRDAFPGAAFVAIGIGGAAPLPAEVVDLRDPAPDPAMERRWISLLRATDAAIGVHGSQLLLPSGLAGVVVELVPRARWASVPAATLAARDPLLALARHRFVYGADDLSDVSGEAVADLANVAIWERPRVESMMTGTAAGAGAGPIPAVPTSPDLPPPGQRRGRVPDALRLTAAVAPARRLRTAAHLARQHAAAARARRDERRLCARAAATALPAVLTDRDGIRFELVHRREVETFLRHGGHFERAEVDLVRRTLTPGMTAVDAGAHIGAFTVAMARAAGPSGRVHAFEPAPARLARTLALNDAGNVAVNPVALADAAGRAELFGHGDGFESWASLAPRDVELPGRTLTATPRAAVRTEMLDAYCAHNGIERIDTLKLDVEGAERRVLAGAAGLLERGAIELLLLELSDATLSAFGDRAHEVVDALEAVGLATFRLDGARVCPFRVAGPLERPTTLVACGESGLARLRAAGAVAE